MRVTRAGTSIVAVLALLVAGAVTGAQAQPTLTSADISRLELNISDVNDAIARVRARDRDLASKLEKELDELREEVIYLKVKLRKEGNVSRSEYVSLRDRLDDLRAKARGEASPGGTTATTRERDRGTTSRSDPRDGEVPVGTEVDTRLQTALSSDTAKVEDRFDATTVVDLQIGEDVVIPAGSVMRGVITGVDKATRTDRKGSLTVAFDQITVRGRSYPMRGTVAQVLESEGIRGETGRIATGAGVGAIIGGILGGFKGALAGILIGAGGTVAATEGKDVNLPAGTILRVRFDAPLSMK